MQDQEMKIMLIEYMGKGFLDNIIALFKLDSSLFRFIPDMLGDDNLHVRLGTSALIEELINEHRDSVRTCVPGLIRLLKHENPTIRGDAIGALGIIKDRSAQEALKSCLQDSHPLVREAAGEALAELG